MFGNETDVNSGSFELEGNLIDYNRGQQCDEDGICVDAIIMTIQDSEGSSTEIVIPIGTGGILMKLLSILLVLLLASCASIPSI